MCIQIENAVYKLDLQETKCIRLFIPNLSKTEKHIFHKILQLPLIPEYIYIYIYTNTSVWAGCDTRSIFKHSLIGLNSKFAFS